MIEEIDDLRGELAILGSPEQAVAADELGDPILEAIGSLEMFAKYSDAWEEIHAIRHARDSFAEAARASLLATESRR
ncbi:hypothetical protein [Arthrobacter sp. ISL-65]|uniref:hypothetical protein n=1 Tax=Arthrobacter sp. ISL-65 TaxID=2819112 RepID=UPI001BE85D3A|nr:hypothetical protein [Arthrobacter sp. ISL-65]MBT2547199.1 hypothetical protein [Arthrobacter sp. ISL-65]